jgi:hypothetical protein
MREMAMNVDELLATLERRGFQVHLVDGGLRVSPFAKLTSDDRAAIAGVAADREARSTLVRLLRERESADAKLSPADAAGIDQVHKGFDAKLIEIRPKARRSHNWPDILPTGIEDQPAATSIAHAKEERPMQSSSIDQGALPMYIPPAVRACRGCGRVCYAAEIYCPGCGVILPPVTLPIAAQAPPPHAPSPPASAPVEVRAPDAPESPPPTPTENPPEPVAAQTDRASSDGSSSAGPAAALASDLSAFRDHIRSRRAALAGFMEHGALLAFENHTLTVFPRNDIYVRYLADNRQVIGELATEFFGCAVKVELAGPKLLHKEPK